MSLSPHYSKTNARLGLFYYTSLLLGLGELSRLREQKSDDYLIKLNRIKKGINNLIIPIKDFDNLVSIRLDPVNETTDCEISDLSLIDFKNYEMILNNNYIILFNK